MTLSVIALFCDNDFDKIPAFLENTKKALNGIDYELILVDNRNEQSKLKLPNNVKTVSYGRNVYLWEGRKLGFTNARGKYIWFVDIDDELCPVNADFFKERDEDLICFNSIWVEDGIKKQCANPYNLEYTVTDTWFFNRVWQKLIKNAVWNKFYKRTVLEEVYFNYPMYLELVFMEDMLLNTLFLSRMKSLRFSLDNFYEYNHNTGDSLKKEYKDIAPLKRLLTGFDSGIALLGSIMNEECQEASGIKVDSIYYGSFLFLMKKYSICTTVIKTQYLNLLLNYFDKKYIKDRIATVDIPESDKQEILLKLKKMASV